jgi:transcriptional regulator with XRE-family HTH domain
MSPTPHRSAKSSAAAKALTRISSTAGQTVRTERLRRSWPLRELAERAGVSAGHLQQLESGVPVSLETYCRVTTALDLWPDLLASDPRLRQRGHGRDQDFVHAAIGELEAKRLRGHGFGVAIDEPYQHYQFAGRADVIAWDLGHRALLHIENRTVFPNIQEALGSYASKRSYLGDVLAERLGIEGRRWLSVSHVIIALWSAEVLHTLRLRTESFRAACPESPKAFLGWWAGVLPTLRGATSSFLLLDPSPDVADRRRFASLDDGLPPRATSLPRLRGCSRAIAGPLEPRAGNQNARRGQITSCSQPL